LWEAGLVAHTDTNGQRNAQGKLVGNQVAYAHAMAQLRNSHSTLMVLSAGLMG
jgi:hypothetical protein